MYDFTGTTVLVTGAANGIGRAAAIRFAKMGAKVAAADIDLQGLEATVRQGGENIVAFDLDVSDEEACQHVVADVMKQFSRLDILCNNAGVPPRRAKLADMSTAEWRRMMSINLDGVFYLIRAVIPALKTAGGGVIINLASVDGQVAMSESGHYVAAKHGVIGLTKTVALEYSKDNIRCVAVAPGYVKTNMTEATLQESEKSMFNAMIPLGRPATPEEISNAIVWLSSSEASYVNGCCHNVDGGILSGFALPE